MRIQWWIASLLGLGLLAGCGPKTATQPTEQGNQSTSQVPSPNASPDNPKALSAQPTQPSPRRTQQPLPVPNLIPPVNQSGEPPDTNVGDRPDPFAALPVTPTVVRRAGAGNAANNGANATNPANRNPTNRTVPTTSTGSPPSGQSNGQVAARPIAPPIAPAAVVVPPAANGPAGVLPVPGQPPNQSPSAPPNQPPLPMAEAIEISGVVEAGGRKSVIVKVPDEATTRYATEGEYLANGEVLIKRIEMGVEPVIVLEQDGREVVRSVGSSS